MRVFRDTVTFPNRLFPYGPSKVHENVALVETNLLINRKLDLQVWCVVGRMEASRN